MKIHHMKKVGFTILSGLVGLPALAARAQTFSQGANELTNPLDASGVGTLSDLLAEVIKYLNIISAPIITAMILYGAFQMLFARDNTKKFDEGRKTIQHAAIGAAIVIVADGVLYVVRDALSI